MNENDQASAPPPIAANPPPMPALPVGPRPKPLSWWLRKFFACNPFYLVSAALLLYGCYRISLDAPFLSLETSRLIFNFTAMQIYEALLVLVAVFLAGRSLWCDSTLLVGLENRRNSSMPFILISQAALTDSTMMITVCSVAVVLAASRFGALKRYFAQLNLPGRLLGVGFVLLAVNVGLPLMYWKYQQAKYGVHLDYGPAYEMNERTWLLILPAVLALANLLPRTQKGDLLPQHRWLPAGLFSIWMIVTCVHLYALDYVYEYYIRDELIAPAALVLAWTFYLCKCPAESLGNWRWFKYALAIPPLFVPLLAGAPGAEKTSLILAGLNITGYLAITVAQRGNRLAPHLIYAGLLFLIGGLPDKWLHFIAPGTTGAEWAGGGIAAYLIFWTAWLRNPKLAIAGSIVLGAAGMAVFHGHAGAGHWALQGSLVFLLLHSLRWHDAEHPDAGKARMLTSLVWMIDSLIWVNSDGVAFWMPIIPGAIVFVLYCVCLPARGIWRMYELPAAALAVILSGPLSGAFHAVGSTPVGVLAVIGSFAFLGFRHSCVCSRAIFGFQTRT